MFQHLKHVIVTDAPTGNPFQRPGIVGWSTGEAHGRRGRAGSGQGRKQTRKQIQLTKVSGKHPKSKTSKMRESLLDLTLACPHPQPHLLIAAQCRAAGRGDI